MEMVLLVAMALLAVATIELMKVSARAKATKAGKRSTRNSALERTHVADDRC